MMKKIFTFFAALACVMSMSAVTYNVTVPAGTKACYIAGEMNSWSQQEMTKVDDTHYTLELADATEAMKYKYCSGPGWAYVEKTATGDEVADRTHTENDVVEAWAAVYDPNNVPSQGETKDITVKAKVPAAWTDQITAWVWATGGDGQEVIPTQEGEWYVYTQNCAELNIIFKNGAGWTGDANQTVDITVTESTCIEITADGVTKATYTVVDCEGGENPGDTTVTPEPTIGVTYNVTVPAGTNACYIAGEMNTWTHQEMTKVDDTHYTLTVADATTAMKYKYCSGPGWAYVEKTATGDEVADRTHTENDVVEAWAAVYDPNNVPSQGETKDITVKAKVPAAWTDQITAWVWATGGEGQEVIPTQEGEWYVYTQNCAELNIIFKNGAGWTGDANQTVDITVTESICIEITAGEGKATYTVIDCEGGENPGDTTVTPEPTIGVTYNVTVPAGTNACYIAGEMNTWTHQEMTKVDDTHYTLTVADATTAMKYKYCSGPGWAYVEKTATGDEVADRTHTENDVVEAWAAVYDPNNVPSQGETKDITVKAKVPAAWTDQITAWVWPTGGEGQEVIPTQEGEWYVYTQNCAELNIIFKNGAGWTGDANQTVDITVTESACVEITSDGATKATYTLVDCEGGTNPENPNPETPVTGAYYVTGTAELVGADKAWNETAIAMTYDESNADYTHTFVGLVADLEYKLKVTNGTWEQSWGYKAVQNLPAGVTGDADGNVVFTLAEAGDVVVTFNGTNMTIAGNFKVTDTPVVPQGTNYVLMGVGGDWTTGIALEVNPDNDEEYQLLCQTISDGDAVKVVTIINGEQTAWCGNVEEASVAHTADDMGNVVLTPGIYDFYFKAAADIMYIGKAACDTTGTTPENPETPNPETGVTYNVTVPAGTNACYIAGEMNTWTHQEMTKVDDTHYTLTIAEATTTMKYKYCSGPGWAYVEKTATGDEVADRTHTENDVVEAWAAVYDPNNVPSQGETKDITVKAKVPAAWTDQITAWVWPTGGEGQEVIPTQEGEWYVYTQNCAELNIIFKNGAGWTGDANQTVDITVTESICIEITAGEGKATYTIVDCPIDGPTTDNEQVVINKKATKIVYNGQICIIRDGVMFNILGQVIK